MSIFKLVNRFRNAHPDHQAIARGMAWVAFFVLLGSLARAAKEMAIAYRYGISAEVDAYLFVFNLVNWPVSVWFSVLTVILVPLAAQIRQTAPTALPRFRSELLGFSLFVGLILAILAWFGLPILLKSSWSGLPPASQALAIDMVSTLSLLAPVGVIIGLFSAWMMAAGRHGNTLLEGVPAAVILLAILAVPGGVEPLTWGTFGGFVTHLVSLALPLSKKGEIEAPRFTRRSSQWTPFWQGFGIMLAGQALIASSVVIDQFFASHLGAGAVATLSYANRILALILGVGAIAVSRATLPVFSRAAAQDGQHVSRITMNWVRLLFALGVVSALIGWWLAPWSVKVLFERGAFTGQDTIQVTSVLRFGLTQLPFYFSGLVLVSYLSSCHKYMVLFWSGMIGLFVKSFGNAILSPVYGLEGIALATVLSYAANLAFFLMAIKKYLK